MDGKVFTLDFVTGQLRLAMVAVLAYGGGRGWFTPTDATFITAIAGALGPLLIPWIWSIVANHGKVSVQSGSAAAAVAIVEKTDAVSASQGASVAVQQAAKAAAVLFIALTVCLFAGDARAQVKFKPLTGNIGNDLGLTSKAAPTSNDPLQNIIGALDAKLLPDLQYAKTMADASGSKVTGPCYGAWIDLINVRQKAVSNPDGSPMAFPDPGLISRFEQIVELRNALQPDSEFMIRCSPVASMVKKDIVGFIGIVISGGAGLATLVPGL